jgi:hypothetical protein
MTMIDTALRAAEMVGLRERTPYERARAGVSDLASQATSFWDSLPSRSAIRSQATELMPMRPTMDWTSLTIGVIVGTAVGFGLGLYMHESMQPAMRTARKKMEKAQEAVKDIPNRLNITRMEEETPTTAS